MSPRQKLAKLLDHWVAHNADHAATYRRWAETARENGLTDVATALDEAAAANETINARFAGARKEIGD
jgi:rubrerythrin